MIRRSWYLLIGTVFSLQPLFGQEIWRPDWADGSSWRIEIEDQEKSSINIRQDTLEIASYGGATVWLDTLLQGDYVITYDREIPQDGGRYDRVSDLNQFWLADESERKGMIRPRSGAFASYDDLDLFYFGMGGNYNTTTRFRRYNGKGDRELLDEKNEEPYLLRPNVFYRIKTVVSPAQGYTSVYIDGQLLFEYKGNIPESGYFGLRLTYSRQRITNLQISRE